MLERPRASVILPHLNEPDLLTCLRALENQRKDGIPFEVIVVDNGSAILPERTVAMVPGVRLLRQPIPGPGPARNLGAAKALAPLLLFIDADCIAMPHWLSNIVRYFDQHPDIDIVGGDIRIRPADAQRLTAVEAYENVYSYRARQYVERYGFAATGNMAVRAAAFQEIGPFGGIGTMEDTEWGQRATGRGHGIAYLGNALVMTPSCRSFAELAVRWDRHVAHEFAALDKTAAGVTRWLLKSMAMALSPVGEIVNLLRTDRLNGPRERFLAFICLARVRVYRAHRMLNLLWHDNASTMVDMWNREKR
jgi:glycosyltransferase involved in cell wall biosynthesis